jgi:hypothetical protein
MSHRVWSSSTRATAARGILVSVALASVASCSSGRSSRDKDATEGDSDGSATPADVAEDTASPEGDTALPEDVAVVPGDVESDDATCDDCDDVIDTDPPLSVCTYPFELVNPEGKTLGQSCTLDSECQYGVCMQPGDLGNEAGEDAINTKFGFCTRGCDCNADTDSRLSDEEKVDFLCYVGPPGSQGKLKYVLPRCSTVADCVELDPGYDTCALPGGSGVFKACVAP